MKANEAPENIYVHVRANKELGTTWHGKKITNSDIEYVHKDAFIEKAVKWIEEINKHHYIMRYSDSCEPPLSELTEWFKNYMK